MFGIFDSFDFMLLYSSINVIFFFYGVHFARFLINRNVKGRSYHKFIIFVIFIILIGQFITISQIKKIPFLQDSSTRGWIALILLFWSFVEFNRVVIKGGEPHLAKKRFNK